MARFQQGARNIPQRFSSILTWWHHTAVAHPWCKSSVPPHHEDVELKSDDYGGHMVRKTRLRWFELCICGVYAACISLGSASLLLLIIPAVKACVLAVAASKLLNDLPDDLVQASVKTVFKSELPFLLDLWNSWIVELWLEDWLLLAAVFFYRNLFILFYFV